MNGHGPGQRPRITLAWAAVLVALLVAAAHARSLGNGFVGFDDDDYIYGNEMVPSGLTLRGVKWAFAVEGNSTYFHPLTWLSLMLDAELFGLAPWWFHLVNVLLHAVTVALLFLVLHRMSGSAAVAGAAALLFGVHPLTVEAVAWATERKTVLSSALGLGAIVAYLRYAEKPAWTRLLPVGLLQAASLLAKPGLVVLPALLLVLDFWPLGRMRFASAARPDGDGAPPVPFGRLLLEKAPLFLVSAAALAAAMSSLGRITIPDHLAPSLGIRIGNALASIPLYLATIAWPTDLALFREFPRELPVAGAAVGAAVLLAVTAAAVLQARRRPWLLAGWLWFLVALSPYLGLKQAGLWPAWADRFAYVPMMGIALALAGTGREIAKAAAGVRTAAASLATIAVAALATATFVQVGYWKDSVTLYGRAVRVVPESAVMQYNLGTAFIELGRVADAKAPIEAAVRLKPDYADAHCQLGTIRRSEKRFVEAEHHYKEALRFRPNHPEALYNYADLLVSAGLVDMARPYYVRFLRHAPPSYAAQRETALRYVR